MASVTLKNVYKLFGDVKAVDDFNLKINDGEFIILVGPSGCGKTTTLRMVAGLERISQGQIHIDGTLVNDLPPKKRDIAMVFQNYALYPHMNVYKNMAFCLKLRKRPQAEIEATVARTAELLNITGLLKRRPNELSGGQRQRVALGRAIVRDPKVFLFDEPLSNLDAKLRIAMRAELLDLHQRLKTTTIYVTHDQLEAMTMADRIVIMHDGAIQQVDTPQRVYDHPANMFVASFIGSPSMNFMDARIGADNGRLLAVCPEMTVEIPPDKAALIADLAGKEAVLGLRPEHLVFDSSNSPGQEGDFLDASVWVIEPLGSEQLVYLRGACGTHVARLDAHTRLRPGDRVRLRVNMAHAHVFEKDTGLTRF